MAPSPPRTFCAEVDSGRSSVQDEGLAWSLLRPRVELMGAVRLNGVNMKTAKKILCPTDFSEFSRGALRDAADFALLTGGTLCVMHVYQNPAYVMPVGAYLEPSASVLADLRNSLTRELDEIAQPFEKEGIEVETKLLEGVPYQAIVDFAKTWGADIIVMGTHGRSGLQHALLGSVAERVVRLAHCPVLVSRTAAA